MKAKTVWLGADSCARIDGYPLYWLRRGKMVFNYASDVRWVNCYGYETEDMRLYEDKSKILGDE